MLKLCPAASRKLWDLISYAELAYHFHGTPHAEYFARAAPSQLGQTRRVLIQAAALGDRAYDWVGEIINQMAERQTHADRQTNR